MKLLTNLFFVAIVYFISLALLGLMIYKAPAVKKNPCQYEFIVTDDSLTVYDGDRTVGTVKMQGQLDSLIIVDNQ